MNIQGGVLSGQNIGDYSVSYSALLGYTSGIYSIQQNGYSYPLNCFPGWSFSRASSAYSLDGTQSFGSNVPRITGSGLVVEGSSTNLYTFSNGPYNGYLGGSNITLTDNTTTGPDGTLSAVTLTDNSTNGEHTSSAFIGSSFIPGTTLTASVFFKYINNQFCSIGNYSTSGASCVIFDIINGTVVSSTGSVSSSTITYYGNGWYRCSASFVNPGSDWYPSWGLSPSSNPTYDGNTKPIYIGTGKSVYMWGIQCEVGSLTSLIKTYGATATRAADSSTIAYSNTATSISVTPAGLGTLTYPKSGVTNLLPNSTVANGYSFFNASSATTSSSVSTAVGPDGKVGYATNISISSGGAQNTVWWGTINGSQATVTSGSTYTMSAWLKTSSGTTQAAFAYWNGSGISTGPNFTITSSWTRYSWTFTASGTTGAQAVWNITVPSSGAATAFTMWGPQVELGSTANGYVPTNAIAATYTPTNPLNLGASSNAPWLGQNIQSVTFNGSSNTFLPTLDFINQRYLTTSSTSFYSGVSSFPGWSFSRSSSGYSLDGKQSFSTNTPRIESGVGLLVESSATNLVVYSIDGVNAQGPGAGTIVTEGVVTTGITDPSGGTGAITIASAGIAGGDGTNWSTYSNYSSGTTYTNSFYVKAGTATIVQISGNGSVFGTNQYANIDLSTGTVAVQVGGIATVTYVGNGWYRLTWSCTATTSQTNYGGPALAFINSLSDNVRYPTITSPGKTLTCWGFQLESGSSVSSLIATTSTSATRAADSASISYSGTATSASVTTPGLGTMTYPAAGVTNLFPNSQGGPSMWTYGAVPMTGSQRAPDGTLTATLVSPTGTFNQAAFGVNYTAGLTYTASCWLWVPSGTGKVRMIMWPSSGSNLESPDLLLTTTPTRYTFTYVNMPYSTTNGTFELESASDNTYQPFYYWGIQVEQTSSANGYVPTTSSSATISPTSPFTISQAPFLGQNIQSVLMSGPTLPLNTVSPQLSYTY